jgi:hypothetical protein
MWVIAVTVRGTNNIRLISKCKFSISRRHCVACTRLLVVRQAFDQGIRNSKRCSTVWTSWRRTSRGIFLCVRWGWPIERGAKRSPPPPSMMDLKIDCRIYTTTCIKHGETVRLSVRWCRDCGSRCSAWARNAALPHVWKAYVGRNFVREGEIPAGSWIQVCFSEPEIGNLTV